MNDSPVPHADALLVHADFVRTVARAALRGDRDVEDVVQETWLAALQSAPRKPGALRAWLGGIARRQAAQRVRHEAALRRRAAAVEPPTVAPSAADTAARVELGRRVVDAVLALREPYREALLLRFYENLPPREIARRLELPVNTVRTRVRRGLEQLRPRLDRAFGDRPHGAVGALLAIAGDAQAHVLSTATGTVGGVIVVKKVFAAAAVLILLVAAAVSMGVFEAGAPDRESDSRRVVANASEKEGGPVLVGSPGPAGAAASPRAAPRSKRSGRVVTRDGRRPLAGIPVYAVPVDPSRPALVVRSDDDGGFDLGGATAGRASVFALGAGWVSDGPTEITKDGFDPTVRQLPLADGASLLLEVTPCAIVEGVVRDEGGAPVAGAIVEVLMGGVDRRPRRPVSPLVATTGPRGRFRHDALLPGRTCAFRVRSARHPETVVPGYVLQAGTRNPIVEVRLAAGRTIPVSVVDAESGAGVADTAVHAYWLDGDQGRGGTWTTGADGLARVGPLPRTRVRLTLERAGYLAPAEPTWVPLPERDAPEPVVELRLDPGHDLRGHVLVPPGLDVRRVRVDAQARGAHPSSAEFGVDAEGCFEIRGLARGAYRLVATLYQGGAWYVGSAEAAAPGHGHRIELARSNDPFPRGPEAIKRNVAEVALRVLSPSGAPLRRGWIRFADEVEANAVDLADGPPRILISSDGAGVRFEVSELGVDEDGAPLGAGQYGPVKPVGGVLTLRIEPGETIRGRVTGVGGKGLGGVQVRALPQTPFDRDPDPQGVGDTHTRSDGSFAVEGLRRGAYLLRFEVPEAYVPPDPRLAVAGGEAVALQLLESRAVPLRVVDFDGGPLAGALVKVAPDDEAEEICRVLTDADGVATVTRVVPDRAYHLVVHPPTGRADDLLLHFGAWTARDSTIVLRRGVISAGLVRDAKARPAPGVVVWYWVEGDPEASSVRTDAQGRFRIGPTPPGTLRLAARRATATWTAPDPAVGVPVEAGASDAELVVGR